MQLFGRWIRLKRDINLIPVKKGDPQKNKGLIVTLVIVFVYLVIFGLAILLPKGIKDAAIAVDQQFDVQILQLQPQVEEYERVKAELDDLQLSMVTTGAIYYSKYDALAALDIIQRTCPTGVSLENIKNSDMSLSFSCVASNNYQIAQFALELERLDIFQSVYISGSEPADLVMDQNTTATTGNAVVATIDVVYDLTDPTATASGEGDADNEN